MTEYFRHRVIGPVFAGETTQCKHVQVFRIAIANLPVHVHACKQGN